MKYGNEGEKELINSFLKSNRIELYDADKLVRIEFVLLDYSSRTKKYAYRIKGLQDNWISITSSDISIGKLPAGEYVLEIKAQLEDGTWQKRILQVPILVIPPFYLSSWFIILSISMIILLIIGIFWFRSKRLKAQNAKLEKIIIDRTEDLQKALGDKDILLKELHHRVKNNLQIVTGLLDLQKARMTDKKAIEALNEGKIRLSSIALIHQNFYRGTNLETISFKVFLTDLVIAVKQLFENEHRIIDCAIQSDDIPVDINIAIPLGLIVNELLTNSYKYLPPEQSDKKIGINLTILENGNYEFKYRDNGPGLPPNIDFENAQTLGLRLISGLTEQINGSIEYKYEGGSVFVIQFNPKINK
jgi:two-component sensor histidine kinase